ncbi:copper chaperone NosL [Cnuella takakiae]|uniref:Copper chaperone NosL n=1 Tax=Cnuella takakiae TaxID=1302690 RepID=A0A1M4X912_9BACT|nr:nitrous oxide reductase accessory protein NosL [Cnuella takakiae]OLY91496.1 hypothetical protein BUE76_05965 [Cnuella takakiae]SHE89906.1 copper chaperone NosL [Cnuella takakiae]
MNKLNPLSRILIAAASLLLIATYFLPIWNIDLAAPQYPEGLSMQIWLYQITGQVEIINGLNHYIGMKHIKAEMFPEFSFLVYVVGGFIVLGLAVAAIGRVKALLAYVVLLLAGGVAAMVDFYQWGYDYGHNLDPTAAIQVPGMAYQPPLIGHKQLLNFDAYSYPAAGGWVIVAAGVLFIAILVAAWLKGRTTKHMSTIPTTLKSVKAHAAVLLLALAVSSCQGGPQNFAIGKDGCHYCKMTIMTAQYGGEVITQKGKVYKFDDLHCMKGFLKSGEVPTSDIAQTLTTNFRNNNEFIDVNKALFVKGGTLQSPMNSNAAGFADKAAAEAAAREAGATITTWTDL